MSPEKSATSWVPSSDRSTRGNLSWAGLVCGIIGVIGGIMYGWTIPLAIAAIILGIRSLNRTREHRPNAVASIVLGGIGLALSIGWLLFSIVVFDSLR